MNEQRVSNSTEKLLNTIRAKDLPPEKKQTPDPRKGKARQEISMKTHVKQALTAGVFISDRHLSMVLTGKSKTGGEREPVKWAHIEIPDFMEITSPRFAAFFRSTLSEFMDRHRQADIWTAIDSRDLKLRNLNIPDVADAKMANAALWGIKKDVEVDPDKEIFDFEFIEDTQVAGVKKKNVVAFSGNRKQILFLKHLFADAGFPLTGITTVPFAMQNFIRTRVVKAGPIPLILVKVGREHSEISCLSDKGVLLTRNIKTGTASLLEELPGIPDDAPEDELPSDTDISAMLGSGLEMDSAEFAAIEPVASRLLDKINRTADYCSNNFAGHEPIPKFLFFGETDDCDAFMAFAAQQIPAKVEKLHLFEARDLSLTIQMPAGGVERAGVIPALGIAFSDNSRTPNFLHTFLEKAVQARYRKLNLAAAAAGIVCLAILGGVWGWFNTQKNQVLKETAVIEAQLAQYTPQVSRQALTAKIAAVRKKAEDVNRYAAEFLPLAVIHEICVRTPDQIDIISLDTVYSEQPVTGDTSAKKPDPNGKNIRSVTLKGVVNAEFTDLEPTLSGYVINLDDSPLFAGILLTEKEVIKKPAAAILAFTANMEIH